MKTVLHVVGARPNFMKVAPVMAALKQSGRVRQILVHTGQHYNVNMSDVFFEQLGLPAPDINLEVGSGTHAAQTAQIMVRFEDVLQKSRPDMVLVYGDVNSTVAAVLVCAKFMVPVGHVEAGLRSFDRTMPEEINRLVTDQLADVLFTPSKDGDANLLREGIHPEKIHFVGNVMIDTLIRLLPQAGEERLGRIRKEYPQWFSNSEGAYALVTLHRPSNVDNSEILARIMETLGGISREIPVIFPIHPRTRQRLEDMHGVFRNETLHLAEPMGYLDFLSLQRHASVVITDSGGIQEETTFLGIPCLTLRENTERPVTLEMGTNVLVGQDMERLRAEMDRILSGEGKNGSIPPLWDGKAGERIAEIILSWERAA